MATVIPGRQGPSSSALAIQAFGQGVSQIIGAVSQRRRTTKNEEAFNQVMEEFQSGIAPLPISEEVGPGGLGLEEIAPELNQEDVMIKLQQLIDPRTPTAERTDLLARASLATQSQAAITPEAQGRIDASLQNALVRLFGLREERGADREQRIEDRLLDRKGRADLQEDRQAESRQAAIRINQAAIAQANTNESIRIGGEFVDQITVAGEAARGSLNQVSLIREFAPQVKTGPLAPLAAKAVRLAKQLGIDVNEEALIGSEAGALQMARITQVGAQEFFEGTKGAISNVEFEAFIGAVAGLSQSEEGNLLMAEIMEAVAKRAIAVEQFTDSLFATGEAVNFATIKSQVNGFRDSEGPIFNEAKMEEIRTVANFGVKNPINAEQPPIPRVDLDKPTIAEDFKAGKTVTTPGGLTITRKPKG